MKHTNGPWEVGHKTINGENWYGVYSGKIIIAHMLQTVGEFNQEQANAHLIASSPTMYKALKEALTLCGGWREVIAELDEMGKSEVLGKAMWACLNQIDDWKNEAEQAIAKAEGD